jgi:hypothetical protein
MQGSPLENFDNALPIHLMVTRKKKEDEDGCPCSYKDPLDVLQSKPKGGFEIKLKLERISMCLKMCSFQIWKLIE